MITLSKNSGKNSKSAINGVVEQNPSATKTVARHKIMLSAVIISLIATTCFFSCLKEKYHTLSEMINNNNNWVGASEIFISIPDSDTIRDASYKSDIYQPIQISFVQDEARISVNFYYSHSYLDSTYNYYDETWSYFWNTPWNFPVQIIFKGNGTYVCDGNNIAIKNIKWDNKVAEKFGGEEWSGTYNPKDCLMGLKNVFGDTVTFRVDGYYY